MADSTSAMDIDVDENQPINKGKNVAGFRTPSRKRRIACCYTGHNKANNKEKVGEEKRVTQEEMLLEAAQTEIINLRNLERVLAREEEVKKKAIVQKVVYNGPLIPLQQISTLSAWKLCYRM